MKWRFMMVDLKVKSIKLAVRTRAQRRAAVVSVVRQLEQIRDAEATCLGNVPGSFAFTLNYCLGQKAVQEINDALFSLNGVYRAAGRAYDDLPF
jgi:hypothetical protein